MYTYIWGLDLSFFLCFGVCCSLSHVQVFADLLNYSKMAVKSTMWRHFSNRRIPEVLYLSNRAKNTFMILFQNMIFVCIPPPLHILCLNNFFSNNTDTYTNTNGASLYILWAAEKGGGKNNCRAFKTEEIRKILNDCWPVSSPCPLPLPNIFQLFQCYCVFYITLSAHELRPFLLESPFNMFKSIFYISIRGLVTYVVYHSKPTIQTHYVVVWTVFRLDRTLN